MSNISTCHNCEEEFDAELTGAYDREGNDLCEYCYKQITDTCCCCEEYFFDPQTPDETFFIVAPYDKEYAHPGVYRALKYPFQFGNIGSGFESFLDDAIRRVADTPKNRQGEDYPSGMICEVCFKKITGNP